MMLVLRLINIIKFSYTCQAQSTTTYLAIVVQEGLHFVRFLFACPDH